MTIIVSLLSGLLKKIDKAFLRNTAIKLLEKLRVKINAEYDAYDKIVIMVIDFLQEQLNDTSNN